MRRNLSSISFGIMLMVLGCLSAIAGEIGPQNQTINPTFDGVVRVLHDGGLGRGIGTFDGTGSIIANINNNGQGVLYVLTCDHVVSTKGPDDPTAKSPGIAFGNSPGNTGNSAYMKAAKVFRPNFNNGPTRNDIAVLRINYGAFNRAFTVLVRNLVPANNITTNLSTIGYGEQANLAATGYQGQNLYGTERYFNQNVTEYELVATELGYVYNAAEWTVNNPANAGNIPGSGVALRGYSGSPAFRSMFVPDPANNLNYLTDNEFAVLSLIRPAYGTTPDRIAVFGSTQISVALDNADITWIRGVSTIPEPTSAYLLGFGILGTLVVSGIQAKRK
jgi:hypothetical protein